MRHGWRFGIIGATGRTGSTVFTFVKDSGLCSQISVLAGSKTDQSTKMIKDSQSTAILVQDVDSLLLDSDIIIDFSAPVATAMLADALQRFSNKVVLIGTTGLDGNTLDNLSRNSKQNKVCHLGNTSLGILLMHDIVAKLASQLPDYDIEIHETHHNQKLDAPSGTALSLAATVAKKRRIDFDKNMIFSYHDVSTKRPFGKIGISSSRGGDIIGDHSVSFFGIGEMITVSHRATDRRLFARGAIRIVELLLRQKENGFFSAEEIIALI